MEAPGRVNREWIRRQLDHGRWFPDLPDTLQEALLDGASARTYGKGECIVAQGSAPDGLYAVLEGQVAFLNQLADDREFLLDLVGPGYWFADPAVLLQKPMPHAAMARQPTRILTVPSVTANRIRNESVSHANHFARLHAARFLVVLDGLAGSIALPREAFLRQRLTDLALAMGPESSDQSIELAISQGELALMIGVSRQTLNGYLSDFEADGLLSVGYRSLQVHRAMFESAHHDRSAG